MALQPKIILEGLSDNADSLILEDITGNHSVNNPGGYNTPNIPRSEVNAILIKAYNEGNKSSSVFFRPPGVSNLVNGTPLTISVNDFTSSGRFSDGVLNFIYNVLMDSVTLTSITNANKTINSNAGFKGNETIVVVGNAIYEVDTSSANTPSTLTLLNPIPSDTVSVEPGYQGSNTIFNSKKLSSNLAKQIAIYAGRCECNKDQLNFLTDIFLKKIGAETRYFCGDIKGAQSIITAANNLLEKGCPC